MKPIKFLTVAVIALASLAVHAEMAARTCPAISMLKMSQRNFDKSGGAPQIKQFRKNTIANPDLNLCPMAVNAYLQSLKTDGQQHASDD